MIRKAPGAYWVNREGEHRVCTLAGKLRAQPVDPVAVGDFVTLNEAGVIVEVLPRSSKLSRPGAGRKPVEQVIAANLDQVVAVFAAARPEPKWNLLDRYLVSAEASELEALICITKMDLADEADIEREMQVYRALGYRVLLTSTTEARGIDALRSALSNRVSALVGKSGVGKTSLLNALQPGLGQQVGAVSMGDAGKGKHTTTAAEMFQLDFGGQIVDTPGIREFGLWEVDGSDIALFFPEIWSRAGACQFGYNCAHEHEPGCAVRQAVDAGAIHPRRYQSYLRLRAGDE